MLNATTETQRNTEQEQGINKGIPFSSPVSDGSDMKESALREQICDTAKSIYDRGLTHGSTGNVSARCEGGWLLTPTGSSLGRLDPARLSRLDWTGKLLSGDAPSKESFLHLAMYEERAQNQAVIHLHSTHSVAVSILEEVDPG